MRQLVFLTLPLVLRVLFMTRIHENCLLLVLCEQEKRDADFVWSRKSLLETHTHKPCIRDHLIPKNRLSRPFPICMESDQDVCWPECFHVRETRGEEIIPHIMRVNPVSVCRFWRMMILSITIQQETVFCYFFTREFLLLFLVCHMECRGVYVWQVVQYGWVAVGVLSISISLLLRLQVFLASRFCRKRRTRTAFRKSLLWSIWRILSGKNLFNVLMRKEWCTDSPTPFDAVR